MKAWVSLVAMNVGGLLGCAPQEEEPGMKDEPRHIEVSSNSAVAHLSCMADHPPLINPIVIRAMNVSEGEDYCFDESYGIRWYLNDALFLDNPLGLGFFRVRMGSCRLSRMTAGVGLRRIWTNSESEKPRLNSASTNEFHSKRCA